MTLYSHFPACFKQKAAAHPSQLLWLTQLIAPAAGQCTDLGLEKPVNQQSSGVADSNRDDKQSAGKKYLRKRHLFTILDLTTIKMENVAPSEVRMTWRFLSYKLSFTY